MSIDVNAAFADEKTAQFDAQRAARDDSIRSESDRAAWLENEVAAGRMTQIAPNAYRVTQGWDAGEVFRVNRDVATGQIAEVVADHGLDITADGNAALFTRVPAWHQLGNVARGDETIAEILALGGMDYLVSKRAVRYGFDGEIHTMDGAYVTVRDDTGAALGTVGERYTVVQNERLFSFLQDLVDTSDVTWESAGVLRGGRRVFVSMRVPDNVVIDRGGIADEIQLYFAAMNSHDASSNAEIVVSPWRPVCKNTERFALRDARARWGIRHTSGALTRLDEARQTLGLTLAYADSWAAEENALAATDLAIDQFHRVVGDLWPVEEDAPVRTRNNATRRVETLDAMFRREGERLGRTAYAAERTLTDYLDHVAPKRPGRTMTEEVARATALLEGADDDTKNRAHRRLMTLVRH
ncbi:DUF932 domain-containing protein [Actinomadura sp. LOL_016]|uniref:DUF932 domain-containing protein n=1 Tax=unclassified Actinomadura TaxID=2626254 RepID=UPI003A7F649B